MIVSLHAHAFGLVKGYEVSLFQNNTLRFYDDSKLKYAFANDVFLSTRQGDAAFLEEQDVVHKHLKASGVKVPRGKVYYLSELISKVQAGEEFLFPITVKPCFSSRSFYIVNNLEEFQSALGRIKRRAGRFWSSKLSRRGRVLCYEGERKADLLVVSASGNNLHRSVIDLKSGDIISDGKMINSIDDSLAKIYNAFPGLGVSSVYVHSETGDVVGVARSISDKYLDKISQSNRDKILKQLFQSEIGGDNNLEFENIYTESEFLISIYGIDVLDKSVSSVLEDLANNKDVKVNVLDNAPVDSVLVAVSGKALSVSNYCFSLMNGVGDFKPLYVNSSFLSNIK